MHFIIVLIGALDIEVLMLVLIVHMWMACHSLMDRLDKGSMCGHLQVQMMKQLENIIIITHYYLPPPVPVLTLHSPGPMKFPLMLVTVTSVTLVLILLLGLVISTRSSWTTLWDGEGCGGSSTCCSFNNPPWFCQHLKNHTSDNLELRLCSYNNWEDKLVSLVEIYVK